VTSSVSEAISMPAASRRSRMRRVISSLAVRASRTGTTNRADSSIQLSVARTNTRGSTSAWGMG
jgi:hypothetical protein